MTLSTPTSLKDNDKGRKGGANDRQPGSPKLPSSGGNDETVAGVIQDCDPKVQTSPGQG